MAEKIKINLSARHMRLIGSLIFALLISLVATYIPSEYQSALLSVVEEEVLSEERNGGFEEDDVVVPEEHFLPGFTEVIRVVDGDTFVVLKEEKEVKVRLIGVDTPESVDPRKKVECFGKEASVFLQSLIEGKYVRLEQDMTQANVDVYGRLLRYVYLSDNGLVNDKLIREGYAHEYTYKVPDIKQGQFKQAQKEAREKMRGLWAPGACS
jgi:micrococcal nuclease